MAADVTGINTNKIGAMKNAIEEWAKAVDAANITVTAKNVGVALKGNTQASAIQKLCQACDSYANTLTGKLREYEARLSEVEANYKKNDTSSTAISSVTSAVKNLKS